ncbi:uncharacterized protein LACBIDRAFT_330971 [Laccaria bicolor S238N-H82]|uniref:Predicted protein n=1 Tax=Laccaria bicolor (strain S238N-H82 / ATCC MYA-4686) TaxID=486041 RepID=B0DMU8_LACBS|nr:uncharacterized protein LACBIDRAFT_330971 [Laccaria bicolor S238N-H82]EDR04033.1 predicted protein [Laccaria bicolor S238N-H82]|eukprot:XP_001885288.1 predicted protein [Laccaria bicolor S238N-H82]
MIRSDKCLGSILDTDEPPCKECWSFVFSNQFQEFIARAEEAKEHTPWELLTSQQMCSLLKKMANTINTLRTQNCCNAIYHLLGEHPADGIFNPGSTLLPKIPGTMMVDMFISLKEENFMKIAEAATLKNRQTYTLPGSDDIEVLKEDLKRERAPTVSVVGPTGKKRRHVTRCDWSVLMCWLVDGNLINVELGRIGVLYEKREIVAKILTGVLKFALGNLERPYHTREQLPNSSAI